MPLEVNFVSKCKLPQPDDLFGLLFSGLLLYNRAARGDDAFEIDELEEILAHLVTTGGEKCAFSRQKYQFLNRELQYGVSTQSKCHKPRFPVISLSKSNVLSKNRGRLA